VSSLCFLPADKIPDQWNNLCLETINFVGPTKKNLTKFKVYFNSYWMKKVGPQKFSVFKLNHKTNNYMESLNSRLKRGFKADHQGFWKSIDLYRKLTIDWTIRELNGLENNRIVKRDRRNYEHVAKIRGYEGKLESNAWSPCHFLKSSSYLFNEILENQDKNNEEETTNRDLQNLTTVLSMCIICHSEPGNAVVIPCGHIQCCIENIKNSDTPNCPGCSGVIENAAQGLILQIFILKSFFDI